MLVIVEPVDSWDLEDLTQSLVSNKHKKSSHFVAIGHETKPPTVEAAGSHNFIPSEPTELINSQLS